MTDLQYRMMKYISEHYTLIVDTREKENERYNERIESFGRLGIQHERKALYAGDYSVIADTPNGCIDYTKRISIERKADLEELIKCFGPERARFERELKRAKESDCRLYVVIENGSYADLAAGNYKNEHSVKNVLATYHAFEQRYDVNFVFLPQGAFPIFAHETFRRYIMDDLMQKLKEGTFRMA